MKFKNTNFQIFVLVVGSIIAIVKFLVYFNTGSNSVLSDALESIVNILAGSFTLYSLYLSSLPADQRHPYGHGKIEFIAAGFEGGLLFLAGIFTVYKIVFSYYFGISIQIHKKDVLIIFVLGFINYLLGAWSAHQGKKTNSPALISSAAHLKSDGYTSLGIFIGLVFVYFFKYKWIDSLIGLSVSVILIYQGFVIVKNSILEIIDTADIDILKEVINYLQENRKTNWIDIHNLRIIKYGSNFHIDAHVTFPWYFNNRQVHNEMYQIHKMMEGHFNKEVELFIHPDPCEPMSCSICTIHDCKERTSVFKQKEIWNIENVLKNEKHQIE